jgi:hypothetical protein
MISISVDEKKSHRASRGLWLDISLDAASLAREGLEAAQIGAAMSGEKSPDAVT